MFLFLPLLFRQFSQQVALAGFVEFTFHLTRLNPEMINIARDSGHVTFNFFKFDLDDAKGELGPLCLSWFLKLIGKLVNDLNEETLSYRDGEILNRYHLVIKTAIHKFFLSTENRLIRVGVGAIGTGRAATFELHSGSSVLMKPSHSSKIYTKPP